jgi:hypothetical protein
MFKKGYLGKGRPMPKGAAFRGFNNGFNGNKKQLITDFNYYLGSAKPAWDYETTTEFLINHIKKTYDYGNDIGSALKEIEPLNTLQWKPRMTVGAEREESIQKFEI